MPLHLAAKIEFMKINSKILYLWFGGAGPAVLTFGDVIGPKKITEISSLSVK